MGPRHRFSSGTRRAVQALVEAVGPPGMSATEVTSVVRRLEDLIGHFPWYMRRGLVLGIWLLQWGGPLMGWRLRPLSALSPEARVRRLRKVLYSRLRPIRLLFTSLKVLISLGVYSEASIEARMGVDRRGWRLARKKFREALLQADVGRQLPPTPEPLGTEHVSPEGYLS
ncbi:MAG: hypothetical protein ACE366_25600 [Bradymonadia bacterium]